MSTTVLGEYINTMKPTFLYKFYLLTSFLRITSLQIINEKLNCQLLFVSMFLCILTVQKLDINQIEIESRLHYIDNIADHRIFFELFEVII